MLIKCPECGRQVSEKAPTCPTCGIQIAGKIIRCPECGEVYFKEDGMCPACHASAGAAPQTVRQQERPYTASPTVTVVNEQPKQEAPTAQPKQGNAEAEQQNEQPKRKSTPTLVVAIIFAAIVCGALFFFYQQAQSNREAEDYAFAMRSTDPEVLQNYLLKYGDAPAEHRDSINFKLAQLQKGDEEWNNAVLSNSRSALQAYIDHNPESVHRQEALNKIDSLDWLVAQKSEDITAVQEYTRQHPDGRYVDDANVLISKLKSTMVQPDEKQMIVGVFRQFFQSINSRNEDRLISTVGMVIDNFLGKDNATSADVISFLNKIYKEDVVNMNWRIDQQSYKIDKREVAENEYEYSVTFSAQKEVERAAGVSTESYRVSAKVTNEGKISGFNLTKLN